LRRMLSLPYNTHSRMISPICDFLPVREELICRCASFIMKCLNSCNSVVHSVSCNGIYGMSMHSPIGANVQFCYNYYGMSPNDIPYVNTRLAWTVLWKSVIAHDLDKINLIKDLLSVKFHKGQISLFCETQVRKTQVRKMQVQCNSHSLFSSCLKGNVA